MPVVPAAQPAPPAQQTLRYTVPPGKQSALIIKTQPKASCTVQPAAVTAEKNALRLFADQNGVARFFVKPKATSQAVNRLIVNCSTPAEAHYDLELRASAEPNVDYPLPAPAPRPTGQLRPALFEQAAQQKSDEELIKGGYPLPPDPRLWPKGYKLWLNEVTKARILVDPGLIENPHIRHNYGHTRAGPKTDPGWSGVELTSGGPYAWIWGTWVVPSVTGEGNGETFCGLSATWLGIDGDNTTDLAQAGTEQDACPAADMDLTAYRAWTELLPGQQAESVLTNITVSPGDVVFLELWIGQIGTGFATVTGKDLFMILCLGVTTSGEEPAGGACFNYTPLAGAVVSGATAEWIMERPTYYDSSSGTTSLTELANFGNVTVFEGDLAAKRSGTLRGQGYVGCCGAGSSLINMTSDGTPLGTTLDTVNTSGGTINFVWAAP